MIVRIRNEYKIDKFNNKQIEFTTIDWLTKC